jgi:hypothetical protein
VDVDVDVDARTITDPLGQMRCVAENEMAFVNGCYNDTGYTHTTTTYAEQTRYGKYYRQRHRRSRAATTAAAALCQLLLPKGPSPSCAPSTSKVAILGVPDTNAFLSLLPILA